MDIDDIIDRLLEIRGSKPSKHFQLNESEIKQLCVASKEIFLQQPNLLELEAPIKICGIFTFLFFLCLITSLLLCFFLAFMFTCIQNMWPFVI